MSAACFEILFFFFIDPISFLIAIESEQILWYFPIVKPWDPNVFHLKWE